MGRSSKRLVQLIEDLAEEHPWLAEEVHAQLEEDLDAQED